MSYQIKKLFISLNSIDVANIGFFTALTAALTIWRESIPGWWGFALANTLLIVLIALLARIAAKRGHGWNLLHGFYMMACIPIAFRQMYFLVPAINPVDYDGALIAIDQWIFGTDPTQWFARFAHPVLTEILQIAYASFYLLPLILAIDYYRMKRMRAFKRVFLTVMVGFYLSYIGYVLVPGIGPRFTLHDFDRTDEELPGLLLTNALRVYTNTGESIPPGTENPAAVVQRDAFPSGHTEVTLLVMLLAFRYRARTRWLLLVTGSLLIVATVYLRYHYVIDLMAGALWAVLAMQVTALLDYTWTSYRRHVASRWGPLIRK